MPLLDPATVVLATIAVSLLLFVTEKIRYDLVAVGVATTLAATGVLTPTEAFGGFSSPAVVLVAAMYVFGAAFSRWGIAEALGSRVLAGAARLGEVSLVTRIVLLSALLSSVLSNAGVVAILVPVLSGIARKARLPVSKLLMPLAFGSLLGGLLSVIATSKNLVVNGILLDLGYEPFGLFEFTPYGLILLAIGALYFVFPGRQLLPSSRLDETLSEHYQVRRFVTEVLVRPSSTLINRSVADIESFQAYGVSVLGIVRSDSSSVLAPGAYNRVRGEDVLLLQGTPEDILRLSEDRNLDFLPSAPLAETQLVASDVQLVEAVVPAGSDLAGRTLAGTDFLERTSLNVLALSKHGELQPGRIPHTELQVGDTLLLQGHDRDVDRLRRSRELLVLGEIERQPIGRGGLISILTLAAVLLIAFLGWMPLSVAALSGAMVLFLTGSVLTRDVYAHLDLRALLLIGGMLALGTAFRTSGLDRDLTAQLEQLGGVFSTPELLVAALMVATALLTQVTTHIAAATIMTPIALSFAEELMVDERAFVMAVVTGASLAFMSPVAHQANAMVVGPGDYRYRDFLRVGTPLTLLLGGAAIFLIPLLFGFGGAT